METETGQPSGDPVNGVPRREYLHLGDVIASAEPCQITTFVGSGVSICLWDKRRSSGGMNYFLLPRSVEGDDPSLRSAEVATRALLERLQALGCRPPNLRAKIFGGAAILRPANFYGSSLGAKNVDIAMSLMEGAGIPVIARQTGGTLARKVVFNTCNGEAWSQKI